ncbi:MAG: histidine phosphatase family protein [Halioglobus sp.]
MDIFLVRHGEAAASWGKAADPGLSDLGKEQALQTAQELLPLLGEKTNLISSPLLRAQETSKPLAELLGGADVAIEGAYSEIPSPVPMAQRQEWLREYMAQQWDIQPDSLKAWRAEMLTKLLELEQPSVIFTHFLVLNTVVGSIQGKSETLCFRPDNASVVRLKHCGERLELVDIGRQMSTFVN